MSLEQSTKLRKRQDRRFPSEENTSTDLVMAEFNTTDSYTYDNSDICSQLTEMKENYERKIKDLQSEYSQLEDLMMAVINKSNEDSPSLQCIGKLFCCFSWNPGYEN